MDTCKKSKRYFRLKSIGPGGSCIDPPELFWQDCPTKKICGKTPERAAAKIFSSIFRVILVEKDPSIEWIYYFHIKEVTRKSKREIFYFRGSILETDRGGISSFETQTIRLIGTCIKSAKF